MSEQQKYKIVGHSNFDDETVSEFVICENLTENWAKQITKLICDSTSEHSRYYYKFVQMDYELYRWEP